ncbi:hypothetical protein DFQ28_002911 [Apophysomyces sp. BC1034]|nr:hypothetical protein DFQ28_002911 [Apophysomyces sp. BC1034]
MVDRHWIIDHLFSEQIPLSQQQQLLAQSIRAYIYNHEDVLHDDTSYPMKNRKGELCFQQAQGLLETCYTISDRDTIRALLHLHMYQLQNGEVNGACQFIDLALRIAQDLKLNQLSTADDRKAEDDRRLWWSVYWTHLHMAAEYNRPMMVNDTACQIPYPHKLEDEKSDVGYCIDFSIHHLKLLKIHFMIAKKLRSKLTVNGLLSMVQDIERQLEEWKSQLPEHTIPEGWTDETDTLCIELAIILRCRLESTKIQMFECFQPLEDHTMSFMELLAIRNCMRAATNITDMLVGYGKGLRMCTCAGMLGVIRRCISVHMANSKSSIPEIAMTAKQKLQDMTGILSCHSFAYMHEANGLVATIQQSFSTTNQVEPVSTPLPSFINNPTPSTSATPPTLDLSQFQMTHPHLFNNLPETLNQAVDWTQSLGFPSSQQPQSSILPSPTFEQVQTATSLSSDTIGTAPIVEAVSLNHRLANPSAAFYQPVEGSHNDKMHRGMAPWAGIPSPLSSDMFDRNEYTRSLQPGWHPQQQ